MADQAEAFFVLPLREAVAHFARRNTVPGTRRSTEREIGSPDNGDTHTSIGISASFGAGFPPLRCEQQGR